jgi:AcrR family transcriptional regulator
LVYVYFPDREALAVGIVEHAVAALRGAYARATTNPGTLTALESTRIMMSFARDNPAAFRQLAGLATHTNRPVVQNLQDRLLARAIELLGGDAEARLLAHGIAGLLRGGASYWLNEQDVDLERACRMLANLVDLVIAQRREPGTGRRAGTTR